MTFKDTRDIGYLRKFKAFDERWGTSPLVALNKLSQGIPVSRFQKQHAVQFLKELQDLIKDYVPYSKKRIASLQNKYPSVQWGFCTMTNDTSVPIHDRMAFEYAVYARYLETYIANKLLNASTLKERLLGDK